MNSTYQSLPRLSIVIATYNAARTLERCIESIISQSFSSWELLIIDGGSTDGTVDIIKGYAEHIGYWHSRHDQGIYDAWNQGLAHVRGEYVCFLGADDAFYSEAALARLFAEADKGQFDLITSQGCVHDPRTGRQLLFGGPWSYARVGRRMVVCHPGMLHRADLFTRFGNFDSSYRIAGDLDFLLRLPANIRTMHIDVTSVLIEAAGISRTNILQRLAEQRRALINSPRHGVLFAYLCWVDKLCRYPLARLLGLPF